MPADDVTIPGLVDLELIGRGGFARVYAGTDAQLQRRVAVKVLSPILDDKDRRRFDRECVVLGRLSSNPNIVTVYSAGYAEGELPYLVMELITDGSLDDQLTTRGRLGWRQATSYLVGAANGLAAAHAEGILHRDIKPENILLQGDVPRLADFGIAHLKGSAATETTNITASWLHTAPETFDGTRDERSDIYSLASTLYALIVGHAPFWRADEGGLNALAMRLVTEQAPVLPADLAPAEVSALVAQALDKDPDRRPQTAAAFAQALAAAIEEGAADGGRAAPPVSPVAAPTVLAGDTDSGGTSSGSTGGAATDAVPVAGGSAVEPTVPYVSTGEATTVAPAVQAQPPPEHRQPGPGPASAQPTGSGPASPPGVGTPGPQPPGSGEGLPAGFPPPAQPQGGPVPPPSGYAPAAGQAVPGGPVPPATVAQPGGLAVPGGPVPPATVAQPGVHPGGAWATGEPPHGVAAPGADATTTMVGAAPGRDQDAASRGRILAAVGILAVLGAAAAFVLTGGLGGDETADGGGVAGTGTGIADDDPGAGQGAADDDGGASTTTVPGESTTVPDDPTTTASTTTTEGALPADRALGLAVSFSDPSTLWRVTASGDELIGTVLAAGAPVELTDLASSGGVLYGNSFSTLYRIDPETGAATEIGRLGLGSVNALAGDERGGLVGATTAGDVLVIDPATAAASAVAELPQGYRSSGDLVVADGTALLTVVSGGQGALAQINLGSGAVTILPDEVPDDLWGLSIVDDRLLAFRNRSRDPSCAGGELLELDRSTGSATFLRCLSFEAGGSASPR